MGIERTWGGLEGGFWGGGGDSRGEGGGEGGCTLCFSRSSLLRGALIITRRTLEGALKCALRDFLREEWRAVG